MGMGRSATREEIAAARAYEALHVPALFRQWAPIVATSAGVGAGQRVLDIACGTGVLAREAAQLTGDPARVSGVDITPGMLAVASTLAPEIDWQLAAAELLPFSDDEFDAVLSQFGLMFFDDRTVALREMQRVLRPGGSIVVAVWDAIDNSPAYAVTMHILAREAGHRAADALRAPFALGNANGLRDLFRDAGFHDATVSTHRGTARFPGIRAMVEAEVRGWLPIMGVSLDEATIARILAAAEQELREWLHADGSLQFDLSAHVVMAG